MFTITLGLVKPVRNDFGTLPEDVNTLLLEGSYSNQAKQIRACVSADKIDLIYSCAFETSFPVLVAWPSLKRTSVKFITGVRGRFNFPVKRKIIEWLISAISSRIICNSGKIKEYVPALFRKKCTVIYNGIAPMQSALTKEEAIQKLHLPNDTKVVGCIARLCADKGQDILVNAFAQAFPNDEKILLVLIGDGEDQAKLRQQISVLKMEKRILLKGNLPNAAQYLPAFDVFALPSRTESFPNALLEALQCGLPCVATKVGGVEEIYAKINFGIMVEKENQNYLSEALSTIVGKPLQKYELNEFSLEMNIKAFEKELLNTSV